MKRKYELVAILAEEAKTEDQEKTAVLIKKLISGSESDKVTFKNWGKKEFSYPIKKKQSGVYLFFEFSLDSEKTASLKQKLQLDEKIIRYLLTVVE